MYVSQSPAVFAFAAVVKGRCCCRSKGHGTRRDGGRRVIVHQQILEILVDTVDAVDVIATHRHFIDFKYVKDIIGIL